MGMYDQLNKISRNIEQNQVDLKKSQEHQKKVEYIQTELEGALFGTLQDFMNRYNYNIFDDDVKAIAIDEVINGSEAELLLYDKDYTRQYLNKKYYTIARQVEQILKKKNANKDDYKKQIAIEKWHMQKQLMQQKVNEKSQKEAELLLRAKEQNRQALKDLISTIFDVGFKILVVMVKITFYIVLIPVKLGLAFLGGFVGGMIKIK